MKDQRKDEEFVEKGPKKTDEKGAVRDRALKIQNAAIQSVQGMRQKLLQKGFREEVVEEVLQDLVKQGVLNDETFAKGRVKKRTAGGYGPYYMQGELFVKGIGKEVASFAISQVADETLIERARVVASTYKIKKGEEWLHFLARRRTAMVRRGFSWAIIKAAEEREKDGEELSES